MRQKNIESLALQLYARLHLRVADALELTCTDPDAALLVYNSACAAKEGATGDRIGVVSSIATVYLPKAESCGYYRLTNCRGYISSKQTKEKGWVIASFPCPELGLQGLVAQCEHWIRTHLPYRPVRFDLPGPGPMELKTDLPGVSYRHDYYKYDIN